jgi:hypothetical protein
MLGLFDELIHRISYGVCLGLAVIAFIIVYILLHFAYDNPFPAFKIIAAFALLMIISKASDVLIKNLLVFLRRRVLSSRTDEHNASMKKYHEECDRKNALLGKKGP